MTLEVLAALLLAHFIGDFVFQSRWMADNKADLSTGALPAHVFVYTLCIGLVAFTAGASAGWLLTNSIAHFVTDAATSRMTKALWRDGRMHLFFVVIGGDQTIHYLTLFGTWEIFS